MILSWFKWSALVKSHLRESDYLVELVAKRFIILLTETNVKDALTVATKICKSVENDLRSIINHSITISIGLGEANVSDTEDTIFKRVDTLLYKSKNNGKNKVSF
ncbi:MAG: diguanylate cyclase [Sulfurimonas sp.]|nr:diguanylate cyclase [Sulfurimonas sp.]